MSNYAQKLMNGQLPTESDWMEHLIEAHKIAPSMTPNAFAPHKTKDGKNSYEILADSLHKKDSVVLDLACGDGYLMKYLLPKLGENGKIHGVDMSPGELNVAKKNFTDSRIQFHEAKAQKLPLANESIDLALSHMAFMLMAPIEPVVSELHRVLKPKGQFSAVIGGLRSNGKTSVEIRNILMGFVMGRYPKVREAMTGDSRLLSDGGLSEIFGNLFKIENVTDFELNIDIPAEGIWDWVKDLYFVGMLPEEEKTLLKKELFAYATPKAQLQFETSMRIFTVIKD